MVGGRAAAAADDRCAGAEHPGDDPPEVGGLGGIDEAALDPLGQPGIRHDRQARPRRARRAGHPIERLETAERTGPAVDSERVHVGREQRRERDLGRGAVGGDELLAERHLGHDRQVRRRPRLADGVEQVAEIGERLEHEQVDPALEQTVDLFPERRPDRGGVVAGQVARRATERADRSGHEDVPSRDVAGLTGELGAAPVQPGRPVREPEAGQPRAVGPERGGLDDVGPRLEVLAMDGPDEVRAGLDELVQAGPLRDAPREQERAHPAVGEQRSLGESIPEALAFVHVARLAECGERSHAVGPASASHRARG